MKQQEKTKRTQERVLEAAIAEFGSKSYDTASLNSICSDNQISKGLIYHNFKGKDDIYLKCVKICYDVLTEYLKQHISIEPDADSSIQNFMSVRQKFFEENPYLSNIFFNSILQPPQHLQKEIHEIRREFEAFNAECFQKMLRHVKLRKGITEKAALEYFLIISEMFNGYFQSKAYQGTDYHTLIEDHDGKLSEIFNVMLYGIAEEKEND